MLAALGACGTHEPPKTVSDVSCALFEPISYAQLPLADRAAALAAGREADDPGNKADTDATVRQIDRHNARWDTACASPLAPPDG